MNAMRNNISFRMSEKEEWHMNLANNTNTYNECKYAPAWIGTHYSMRRIGSVLTIIIIIFFFFFCFLYEIAL